jgi:hypothetical protein
MFAGALFSIPLGLERGQTGSYHSSLAFEFLSQANAKSNAPQCEGDGCWLGVAFFRPPMKGRESVAPRPGY